MITTPVWQKRNGRPDSGHPKGKTSGKSRPMSWAGDARSFSTRPLVEKLRTVCRTLARARDEGSATSRNRETLGSFGEVRDSRDLPQREGKADESGRLALCRGRSRPAGVPYLAVPRRTSPNEPSVSRLLVTPFPCSPARSSVRQTTRPFPPRPLVLHRSSSHSPRNSSARDFPAGWSLRYLAQIPGVAGAVNGSRESTPVCARVRVRVHVRASAGPCACASVRLRVSV